MSVIKYNLDAINLTRNAQFFYPMIIFIMETSVQNQNDNETNSKLMSI